MPDLGATATATLSVDPFDGTTAATLTVHKADGTTSTTPAPTTADGGATWTRPVTYDQPFWWLLSWVVTGTGAGVKPQHVYVAPADLVPPGLPVYATLEQLKHARQIPPDNTGDDDALNRALRTGARAIDRVCHRRFWLDTAAAARQFRTTGPRLICEPAARGYGQDEILLIDDLGATGALVVELGDGITWTTVDAGDYDLEPLNAIADRQPVTQLRARGLRWSKEPQVRVTERWGWPALPADVAEANLILSNRLYLRKDSPEGVAGSSEWGVIRLARRDPDVRELLGPYELPELGD